MKRFSNREILWGILALAAILRVAAAVSSIGFEHPNEMGRMLEPLAYWSGFQARLPWEWLEKLLSLLPLKVCQGILGAANWSGITDPVSQTVLLKLIYGFLSLFQVLAAWRLVLWAVGSDEKAERPALFAALMVAIWPEFIYRSVRLMDYSLEASMLAASLLLVFPLVSVSRARLALSGAILGMLFFARYQSGLYFLSIALLLAISRRTRSLPGLATFTIFYGAVVGGLALVEAATLESSQSVFSTFLLPFRNYIRYNLIENGAAVHYGADPWHRYFSEGVKFLGVLPFLLLFLAPFVAWIRARKIKPFLVLTLFLIPFVVHTLLSHKEGRFLYGVFWLMIPAGVAAIWTLWPWAFRPWAFWPWTLRPQNAVRASQKAAISGIVLILLISFAVQSWRVSRLLTLHADDVRAFTTLGALANTKSEQTPRTLVIYGDPDFLPGQFFLRWPGKICFPDRTPECNSGPRFIMTKAKAEAASAWVKPIATERGWGLFSDDRR